jgi:hypothetical protein
MNRTIELELDEEDYDAVQDAIALYQSLARVPGYPTILPDGDSNLAGAILAQICRGWADYWEKRMRDPPPDRTS